MTDRYAIIVAGGKGTRFQNQSKSLSPLATQVPKQFMLLKGKPVLMHTLQQFHDCDPQTKIILVLPANQTDYWQTLCQRYDFTVAHTIVHGGSTRTESVSNGLRLVPDNSVVAIHDGVRPLVSTNLIAKIFLTAQTEGSAIPTLPATDTLRHITGKLIDRNSILLVQTPQAFNSQLLKLAYQQAKDGLFTDDASVFEKAGNKLTFIEGERTNIKITTPFDLTLAQFILNQQA